MTEESTNRSLKQKMGEREKQSIIAWLFSHRWWPLFLFFIITFLSLLITAVMNIINSLIWWGRIDLDLILIGCIDSFVVTSLITPAVIYFIKNYFNLEEMNRKLQKEVDERKMTEVALRDSEEKYRLLTENMHDILWTSDLEMNITYLSPSIEKVLNFTVEERMKHTLEEQMPSETLRRAMNILAEELQFDKERDPDRHISLDLNFFHKDGSVRCLENTLSFIRDENSKPVGIHGLARDITDQNLVEEELRESRKRLQKIVDNARDVIWMLDMDTRFTFISPAIENMLGYTVEEYLAKPHSEIIVPASLDLLLKVLEEELVLENDPQADKFRSRTIETEQISKSGARLWVELKMNFIHDENGKPVGILGFSRDITERKQINEALKKSEDKYRLIAENTADLIETVDLNFRPTYVSPASMRLRGFTVEEAMEQTIEANITPESLQLIMAVFEEEMQLEADGTADPNRTRIMEVEVYKKDGSTIWVEVSISFLRDQDGKPVEILAVVRDISTRKQAEAEKKILEERLQQADKLESIGTLAGGIAHDFNNLLMGIHGLASLTLLNLDPSDPNYERLEGIEQQVQSGADLTRQLLGFARGGRYEVKPTNINEILEKTSSMFGRTKKEITLQRKLAEDLWNVEVDRGQIEQALLNLYINAWQAMPGGGDLYLETQNVCLSDKKMPFSSIKPGKYVKITITDTGTGMDEKTRERIFDPFFTTKEMGRGTGLGLATVYGIITGHQGIINVYSEPGHGTTFNIYLPTSDKEVIQEQTAAEEIATGTETVLLVDDEKTVVEVNKELLAVLGYKVFAAGSGQEAIAVYLEKKETIDLIILDMIMPGISGAETFDRLRKINPNVKVLLSSGYSLNGEAQSIMNRGCNGFLQKPFSLTKLSGEIRKILG
ncbi:MAG: hypothetical protein CVU52_03375 [Deltaproteobacteria bacterium HGW-Deltaproteobacteria-10]|nr:MAG: hypothetical protein CVU52_03375 [Deltaproteobacteria bacterium HGW-Deltaproteobacteria-10]